MAIKHQRLSSRESLDSIPHKMSKMQSLNRKIMMKSLMPLMLLSLLAVPLTANALLSGVVTKTVSVIGKISTHSKALPDDEIIRLSKLSDELKGTKKLGKELGKLNLPDEVLEDTFMRIAVHQGKISRTEAEGMFRHLGGTPGFRSTLRKVIGNSANKTSGHLNELRIADNASRHGFEVLGIGRKFSDGLKKGDTDIDVILKKGNQIFAIEAKEYKSTTKLNLDDYRADLDTLIQFKKKSSGNIVPVFSITNKPKDLKYLKRLQYEADKRGVQLIFGPPEIQVEKVKLLSAIL